MPRRLFQFRRLSQFRDWFQSRRRFHGVFCCLMGPSDTAVAFVGKVGLGFVVAKNVAGCASGEAKLPAAAAAFGACVSLPSPVVCVSAGVAVVHTIASVVYLIAMQENESGIIDDEYELVSLPCPVMGAVFGHRGEQCPASAAPEDASK